MCLSYGAEMMDGEIEYLFEEIQRQLLLARSSEKAEAEKYIDEVLKNVNELKRIIEQEN